MTVAQKKTKVGMVKVGKVTHDRPQRDKTDARALPQRLEVFPLEESNGIRIRTFTQA